MKTVLVDTDTRELLGNPVDDNQIAELTADELLRAIYNGSGVILRMPDGALLVVAGERVRYIALTAEAHTALAATRDRDITAAIVETAVHEEIRSMRTLEEENAEDDRQAREHAAMLWSTNTNS